MEAASTRRIRPEGLPPAACCARIVRGARGRNNKDAASSVRWIEDWSRVLERDPSQWAYAYPATSTTWKNSKQFVQTVGPPPNQGKTKRPIIGCTWNSRNALRKMVSRKRKGPPIPPTVAVRRPYGP